MPTSKSSVALTWEPPVEMPTTLTTYLRGLADAVAIRREQVQPPFGMLNTACD